MMNANFYQVLVEKSRKFGHKTSKKVKISAGNVKKCICLDAEADPPYPRAAGS